MHYKLLSNFKPTQQLALHRRSCCKNIAAGYKPKDVESRQRSQVNNGNNSEGPQFDLLLPPPNVTGHLHLGHALMCTIQDVVCRWKQQQGFNVNWIPGLDHAGIATQVVVEKFVQKNLRLTRHQLGRDRFIKEIWKWRADKGASIKNDLKNMGTILNWNREYFTMDERQSKAVVEAFTRLFEQNLIYRGESLVNWSCALESTISDIEIELLEISEPTALSVPGYEKTVKFGEIYDISYAVCDGSGGEIVVSTTRPETFLGDLAVAVHPDDQRYKHLQNSQTKLWHPFRREKIPLIFDDFVDPEFGTGAVKITPAHDKVDYEFAKRHALTTSLSVINEKGLIAPGLDKFSGMPRFIARDEVIKELYKIGLFRGRRSHKMQLPMCSRSKDVIEFLLKPQWFVDCSDLSKNAIRAVEDGRINIMPEHFRQNWIRWLEESRDWCISRQLWWGHRVPAFECSTGDEKSIWVAAATEDEARQKAEVHFKSSLPLHIKQDPDVLDTWFSSALLPFSVFGWPDENFRKSYPQDLLETGHDILFFWVARMVMLSQNLVGDVPFRNILLHGIVCDAQGRKMSKSLGNVISPAQIVSGTLATELKADVKRMFDDGVISEHEMKKSLAEQSKLFPKGIPECGTDALRFTLCSHNIKSHFINFDVNECYTNKLFFNKIWQATRYTLAAGQRYNLTDVRLENLCDMDKWILSRLANTISTIEKSMNEYNFHMATMAIKMFFYANLCDVYLETTKSNINQNNEAGRIHCVILNLCLRLGLQHMQQFTPFLCQELLQYLLPSDGFSFEPSKWLNTNLETDINSILDICAAIRQLNNENKISKKHQPIAYIVTKDDRLCNALKSQLKNIETLTFITELKLATSFEDIGAHETLIGKSTIGLCSFAITIQNADADLKPSAKNTINDKKLERLENDLAKMLKTMANESYRKSASDSVQAKHTEKIRQLRIEIENIRKIQG